MAEPSLAPDYLLRAVRTFLAAVAEGEAGDGGPPAAAPAAEAAAGGPPLVRERTTTSMPGLPAAVPPSPVAPPASHPALPPALPPAGGDEGEAALGWEEAGCLVWDAAALPDDAAFLVQHGVPAMLLPLLSAACAGELWRELEIGLGILGNLACQPAPKRQLLGQEALPALLLDRLLWVDDAASLGELCRCLAGLLVDGSVQPVGLRAGGGGAPSSNAGCTRLLSDANRQRCPSPRAHAPSSPLPPRRRPRRAGGRCCSGRRR